MYPTLETTLWFAGVVIASATCVWFGFKIPLRFQVTRRVAFTVSVVILAAGKPLLPIYKGCFGQ